MEWNRPNFFFYFFPNFSMILLLVSVWVALKRDVCRAIINNKKSYIPFYYTTLCYLFTSANCVIPIPL